MNICDRMSFLLSVVFKRVVFSFSCSIYLSFLHAPGSQARNVYLLSSIVESIQVSLVMNCQGWINSSCDTSFASSTKAFDYRAINLYTNNQIIKTACIVHGQLIDSHMLININSPDFLLTTSHELDPDPEMLHSWSYHYRHLWKTY